MFIAISLSSVVLCSCFHVVRASLQSQFTRHLWCVKELCIVHKNERNAAERFLWTFFWFLFVCICVLNVCCCVFFGNADAMRRRFFAFHINQLYYEFCMPLFLYSTLFAFTVNRFDLNWTALKGNFCCCCFLHGFESKISAFRFVMF